MRFAKSACLLALCLLSSCRDTAAAPIRIDLGPAPTDELTLIPKASLAELIEVSPTETALLLTLSSAKRTCEALADTDPDAAGVAIRLLLPAGYQLKPGSFPLLQDAQSPDKPRVLSTVKLHGRRTELRPGGELTISQVDASPQGSVEGLLKFEFTGDAEHPATRVSGHFLAHFCRINRMR
ncbi:MAG TPA: hypothetical protein VHP33_25725 [Polyangiaceae bacterium]|nr:hypothetical protein [Polyangiaceae bacterium]